MQSEFIDVYIIGYLGIQIFEILDYNLTFSCKSLTFFFNYILAFGIVATFKLLTYSKSLG